MSDEKEVVKEMSLAKNLHKCEQKDAMPSGWLMNVRFISLF